MRENVRILGPDGRPVKRDQLTREMATPTLTGLRSVWSVGSVASGLTPARLASLLNSASDGDALDYLVLAEEMEEREPHYASVLGTRKRAVGGIDPSVEAASDEARDAELADAVRELVRKPAFGEMTDDLLDALGKGFSVCEILWNRSQKTWHPGYARRDPRFFQFDRADGRILRLIDEANPDGLALPPYKFIVHMPRLKSGLPIRGGLARLAAVSYLCKAYTLKDWMAFAEVFGMPLRLGRYGPGATEDDIQTLVRAVANIGSDAAAVLPESMRIEFQEAASTAAGDGLFLKLAEWLDRQISKAVLGQVATTEGIPGRLGNDNAQEDVRKDILRADAKQLANTLNRDLVRPFVDLNFGPQANYPRILLSPCDPENTAVMANALAQLVPLGGLGIEASVVRDKLGFPDPEPGAELLGQTAGGKGAEKAENQEACACGHCQNHAMNRAREAPDTLDLLAVSELADWQEQMGPIINPVLKLAREVESYEAFLEALPGLLGEMDVTQMIKHMAEATFKARGMGDATDEFQGRPCPP